MRLGLALCPMVVKMSMRGHCFPFCLHEHETRGFCDSVASDTKEEGLVHGNHSRVQILRTYFNSRMNLFWGLSPEQISHKSTDKLQAGQDSYCKLI